MKVFNLLLIIIGSLLCSDESFSQRDNDFADRISDKHMDNKSSGGGSDNKGGGGGGGSDNKADVGDRGSRSPAVTNINDVVQSYSDAKTPSENMVLDSAVNAAGKKEKDDKAMDAERLAEDKSKAIGKEIEAEDKSEAIGKAIKKDK